MALIAPFRGLRYNPEKVGSLADVVAPPYDVISAGEQDELHNKSPYNIVRLILGKSQPDDTATLNQYTRAGVLFEQWVRDSVLVLEQKPAMYAYAQDYTIDGRLRRRLGFLARFSLADNSCLPHEHTLNKPKEDRLRLLRQVPANLSPIFSFFIDSRNSVTALLQNYVAAAPLIDVTDKSAVRNRVWRIDDPEICRLLTVALRRKDVYIADGHHRFEVARQYRDELRRNGTYCPESESVLMFFTALNHENLYVLPTHRLVRAFPGLDAGMASLRQCCLIQSLPDLETLVSAQRQKKGFCVGMYEKGEFSLLRFRDKQHSNQIMAAAPDQWRTLDVARLNAVVFEYAFKLGEAQKEAYIAYTRDASEAVRRVDAGDYAVAFFPRACSAAQVKQIAQLRLRMPQKSTYFYPKLLSGLLINPLFP